MLWLSVLPGLDVRRRDRVAYRHCDVAMRRSNDVGLQPALLPAFGTAWPIYLVAGYPADAGV